MILSALTPNNKRFAVAPVPAGTSIITIIHLLDKRSYLICGSLVNVPEAVDITLAKKASVVTFNTPSATPVVLLNEVIIEFIDQAVQLAVCGCKIPSVEKMVEFNEFFRRKIK